MKVKCPFCSRMVEVSKKGLISQHANLPVKICLGSGQPAKSIQAQEELIKQTLEERRASKKK